MARQPWTRHSYIIAIACVAVALALRLALNWLLGPDAPPLLLFLAAVATAGYIGGTGPALLAVGLGAAISVGHHTIIRHRLTPADVLRLAVFAAAGVGIAAMCGALHRQTRRANEREDLARAKQDQLTREVEKRETAEHSLLQAQNLLAAVFDQLPAGVIVAAADTGTVQMVNRRAKEMCRSDIQPGTPIGVLAALIQPRVASPDDQPIVRAIAGEGIRDEEVVFRFPDGTGAVVSLNAGPVRDILGQVASVVVILLDVTIRKQAEDALREADRRKDEFLTRLGHELRNPLGAVCAAVETLRHTPDDAGAVEHLGGVIERQVRHVTRLVEDLLDVSRITRDKIRLRKQHVELATVIEHAIETSRPLVERRHHRLTVVKSDRPVSLYADPDRLVQIISNLLNNAAKYTPEAGSIELRAQCEPRNLEFQTPSPSARFQSGVVEIRVKDTGIGIPPDKLTAVFEPFAQLDESLSQAMGGLGVGLPLVRHLVELHGGTVEALSSGVGKGSEFIVRLPISEMQGTGSADADTEPQANGSPPDSASRVPRSSPHRVLVVDDNSDAADALAGLLRVLGQEVRTAYDGPAAVQAVAAFDPDLVLMDLGMPGMNGYDVAAAIRDRRANGRPVLAALTGRDRDQDREQTREAGFEHYLVKPVGAAELRELLAGVKRG